MFHCAVSFSIKTNEAVYNIFINYMGMYLVSTDY
nr:MAG TPA: hypothetical protein [Caudoviricetes sp.]